MLDEVLALVVEEECLAGFLNKLHILCQPVCDFLPALQDQPESSGRRLAKRDSEVSLATSEDPMDWLTEAMEVVDAPTVPSKQQQQQ